MNEVVRVWSIFLLAMLSVCRADVVNLGYASFDTVIPGAPGSPGALGIHFSNLTGIEATLPDFNVSTAVILRDVSVTVKILGVETTTPFGDIGPGFAVLALLSEADLVESIAIAGTISPALLALANGSTVGVDANLFALEILPSSGPYLIPDVDFALLQISTHSAEIPEPGSWALLATGIALAFPVLRRVRRPAA